MPDQDEADETEYRVSSYSGGANCVAVARLPGGGVAVRHSDDSASPLRFTTAEWRAFVDGVKDGEFDVE